MEKTTSGQRPCVPLKLFSHVVGRTFTGNLWICL